MFLEQTETNFSAGISICVTAIACMNALPMPGFASFPTSKRTWTIVSTTLSSKVYPFFLILALQIERSRLNNSRTTNLCILIQKWHIPYAYNNLKKKASFVGTKANQYYSQVKYVIYVIREYYWLAFLPAKIVFFSNYVYVSFLP